MYIYINICKKKHSIACTCILFFWVCVYCAYILCVFLFIKLSIMIILSVTYKIFTIKLNTTELKKGKVWSRYRNKDTVHNINQKARCYKARAKCYQLQGEVLQTSERTVTKQVLLILQIKGTILYFLILIRAKCKVLPFIYQKVRCYGARAKCDWLLGELLPIKDEQWLCRRWRSVKRAKCNQFFLSWCFSLVILWFILLIKTKFSKIML